MSPNLIGALMFFGIGIADYFMLGYIKDRAIRNGTDPARLRLLELMRFLQLILFPMLGFFAGPDIVARWNE